jgi:sulfoxide reductase heme-binding subunit YedZ
MEGPFLWHLNRGSGLVLLVLLTVSALLGIWATRGDAGARVPRFAVQALHRNLALLGVVLSVVHVASAVLDEFVDIRWWQAFLPWRLAYQPLWLASGVVALDLLVAMVVTSLVRGRLPRRSWQLVHLGGYLALVLSFAHGLGIGTDTGEGWARWAYLTCGVLLAVAATARAVDHRTRRRLAPRELDTVAAAR